MEIWKFFWEGLSDDPLKVGLIILGVFFVLWILFGNVFGIINFNKKVRK